MSKERSQPNFVAQKKYEAIDYWDKEARQRVRQGKYLRGFGNWMMKQLAKAHSESWAGLALDVLSLGSGGLMVKGVQGGARAIKGLKAIKSANTMMEIDRTLRPVRASYGIFRPLAKTRHQVLEGIGKAAEKIENIAPKFIKPLKVTGKAIVTPRRGLKAISLLGREVTTEIGLNKRQEGRKTNIPIPNVTKTQTNMNFPRFGGSHVRPYISAFDINRLKQPTLSYQSQQEIMRKGIYVPGVWGLEVGRRKSGFNINKIHQPPISKPLEQEIMKKGVYVPGVWGMEINHSRPLSSPFNRTWSKTFTKSRPIDPYSFKPRRSVLEVGPNTPLNPKYHWVFPPDIVTRSNFKPNTLSQFAKGLR